MAATVLGGLLLSLLPLPDAMQPFPSLRSTPATALRAALWPARGIQQPQPEGPEGAEPTDRAMVFEEMDLTGGAAPASNDQETRRWEKLIKGAQAAHTAIEDPCIAAGCTTTALTPFFGALRGISDGTATGPVRVITLGTSLIASDHITDVTRRLLQTRHGSGGLGFMFVDRPTRNAGRTVRSGSATGGWVIEKITDAKPPRVAGLGGVSFTAPGDKPQETVFLASGTRRVELFLVTQPGGGALRVFADGAQLAEVATDGPADQPLFHSVKVPLDAVRLTLKTQGGPVRLDGVVLENGKPGVVFDSLGLPGATAQVLLREDAGLFQVQLEQRKPSLVVLMIGGNDAFDISLRRYTPARAREAMQQLITRVKSAAPAAACLLAAPPDAGIWRMDKTIATRMETRQVGAMMKELAASNGCAWYDMQAAMGGEGSISRWWNAGLMNRDLVHPLATGGDVMGYLFDAALERARTRHDAALKGPRGGRRLPVRRHRADTGGAATEPKRASPAADRGVTIAGSRRDAADRSSRRWLDGGRGLGTSSAGGGRRFSDGGWLDGGRGTGTSSAGGGRRFFDGGWLDGGRGTGTSSAGGGRRSADGGSLDGGRGLSTSSAGIGRGFSDPAERRRPDEDLSAGSAGGGPDPDGGEACFPDAGLGAPKFLAQPQALAPFFTKLRALEERGSGRVAIAQLGASHTAAQYFTDEVRRLLADRFGYAGRGFVAAGKATPRLEAAGVTRSLWGSWKITDALTVKTSGLTWGLTGIRAEAAVGASLLMSFDEPGAGADDFSRVQVYYLDGPDGGTPEVRIDGKLIVVPIPATPLDSAVRVLEVGVPGSSHLIAISNPGPGTLSVFGVSHELIRPGIVYDALGLPGSTATTLAAYAQQPLAQQLEARQVDLFVLFYGTNESSLSLKAIAEMKRSYPGVLATLRLSAPEAACLFLGPTDRMTKKGAQRGWREVESINEVQAAVREIALGNGCAFWSTRDVMGGKGSIAQWRKDKLANKDHVHLTAEGYQKLAGILVSDLMQLYESWSPAP